MATADNNYFYSTWGDNRLSDAFFADQPDVRFAKIPVTKQDDGAATVAPAAANHSLAPTVSLDLKLLLPNTESAMPAIATTGATVGSAPAAHESGSPTASTTEPVSHGRAMDVIFAAVAQVVTDDS